jgi:hypothetical protein
METTNELLDRVLVDVFQLIKWAAADFDHSTESGYEGDAQGAAERLTELRVAQRTLQKCFK